MSKASFIDLAISGDALLDEIDDFIVDWHEECLDDTPIHSFLGMSLNEYSIWVIDPATLPYIVKARKSKRPIEEVLGERVDEFKLAARATSNKEVARLENWLRENRFLA